MPDFPNPKHPPRVQPAFGKILYFIETSHHPEEVKAKMRSAWSYLNRMLILPNPNPDPHPQLPIVQDHE